MKMRRSRKSERIAAFVETLSATAGYSSDPRYVGYFECFNRGDYYEAHDVLEDLWLETEGADREFYKGLIQVAGCFVHLKKQWEQPEHSHHGRRMIPAVRIFRSAIIRLRPFAPHHLGVDVSAVLALCKSTLGAIVKGNYRLNPWSPAEIPKIGLTAISHDRCVTKRHQS